MTAGGPSALVRLYAGFGNNIFQIVAGHAVAARMSARLGFDLPCRIILPDSVDAVSEFSVFEVIGGHLRSETHYTNRHAALGLPRPDDLAAVLPNLDWIALPDEGAPRRRLRRRLAAALAPGGETPDWFGIADYFSREEYINTCCDARHRTEHDPDIGRVLDYYFSPTAIPFSCRYWDPEARRIAHLFEPDSAVARYLESTYRLDATTDAVGIHLRNFDRIPDGPGNERVEKDRVSTERDADCVADIVEAGGTPRVFIVSNRVAPSGASPDPGVELKRELERRFPAMDVVLSNQEPYYIDFFLLRMCTALVISCSTFSFGAGMTSSRMRRMYVPNSFSERHFCNGEFPDYCRFMPDRV